MRLLRSIRCIVAAVTRRLIVLLIGIRRARGIAARRLSLVANRMLRKGRALPLAATYCKHGWQGQHSEQGSGCVGEG